MNGTRNGSNGNSRANDESKRGISAESAEDASPQNHDIIVEDFRIATDAIRNMTEEHRITTDAIHPRFQDRTNLLFKCRSCGLLQAKERKMQKHFFKNCPPSLLNPRYSCPLPECGGPSFVYEFKSELRIYHSCKEWAKFCKTRESNYSLTNSSVSFSSSNQNSGGTSLSLSTSKFSFESTDESREGDVVEDMPSQKGDNGVLRENVDYDTVT